MPPGGTLCDIALALLKQTTKSSQYVGNTVQQIV